MAFPADHIRPAVFKVRRDTVALVLITTATTFALSDAIHVRRTFSVATMNGQRLDTSAQDWTGNLAELSAGDPVKSKPFTSASLVVPQSELALPVMPIRPLVKLRGCEGSACVTKSATYSVQRRAATLPQRDKGVNPATSAALAPDGTSLKREVPHRKPTFMSRLNPLSHLPDVATVKRPFAYAGDAVADWFKRF